MRKTIIPVLLTGGSGTRLWPLSRPECPKQFLPGLAAPGENLFSATLRRVADTDRFAPPMILCNQAHRQLAGEEIRRAGVAPGAVLIEPFARNTAPAAAAAVRYALREYGSATLVILPGHAVRRQHHCWRRGASAGREWLPGHPAGPGMGA